MLRRYQPAVSTGAAEARVPPDYRHGPAERSPMVVVVRDVPWWGLVSSAAAPVLLVGGWTLAAGLQPGSFDAVAGTISSLASRMQASVPPAPSAYPAT